MENFSTVPVAPPPPFQQPLSWYYAATLPERLSAGHVEGFAGGGERKTQAEKIVQRWKAQRPFNTGAFFAKRLQMDAITEQDLLALLAEPLDALQARLSHSDTPDWVKALIEALQSSSYTPSFSEHPSPDASRVPAIVRPFYPLLQGNIARLQAGIEELAQRYEVFPFNPQSMLSLLLPHLWNRIEPQVSKTVVLELNIARLRGRLQGETAQERFHDFLRLLQMPEHLQPFLEEYSVLARQLLISSQIWADVSLTFLQRLCADWQEILTVFAPEQEPGELTSAAGGAGDTHRGGQSVIILTFSSGWRLVYKPRSLAIDVHFQELLNWLNAQGSHLPFPLLKLITKAHYGWSEFISVSDCSSEEEVQRFYERQGGYLALLYMLGASDFHLENVIAAGEHPFLVDLEALFHPQMSTGNGPISLAQHTLDHSVLRAMLLPVRILSNDEHEGIDVSGLARRVEGQLSPHLVPRWEDAGTDEMRLERKRVALGKAGNCPRLSGQEVQPLDYIETIIAGFRAIYALLMVHQDTILEAWLPRFAHDEIRCVARNTRAYALLLSESFHPNLLRDALRRERFFDHLWLDVANRPILARLIRAERADLYQADIPLFTTRPDSHDLWTSHGECLHAFFEKSSLESVGERLQQFSEEDLNRQVWLIRASFATIVTESAPPESSVPAEVEDSKGNGWDVSSGVSSLKDEPLLSASGGLMDQCYPNHVPHHERFLAEARAIGDRLCTSALQNEEQANWIGLTLVRDREWQITVAGLDLYSGLPGILLFLAYLGQITREKRYTDLARTGLRSLQILLEQNHGFLERVGIGALSGLGSCVYLYSHLIALWQDASLLRKVEELVEHFPGMIEKDETFDLVSGSAGGIAGLLSLYAIVPSHQTMKVAIQCGTHLLSSAQSMQTGLGWRTRQQDVPLTGFSQGTAGIAWSLLRLATATGEGRFRDTALQAMAYERSLFSPKQCNWPDLRKRSSGTAQLRENTQPPREEKMHYSMSWSHGAPGIALGRLLSLPHLDDVEMQKELETALRITLACGTGYSHELVGSNHSLAHGDGGNLDIVLLAAQKLQDPSLRTRLARLVSQFLASGRQSDWIMGVPFNVETVGLMEGLAGIGYQCLRLAEPERVPSVLALAPPLPGSALG
ncbi:MAG TPA: type 2 lanthipeptide synthetase LanM family protein [Ktedonobacteraceae bacterium]|nr:type 2 lanthipeptide synthetase LanM family protein [Ktedonobacteraceae bacterium]